MQLLHGKKDIQILFEDFLDRDVIDLDLAFPDEEKQEVERAFKDLELYTMISFCWHGRRVEGGFWEMGDGRSGFSSIRPDKWEMGNRIN